MVDHLQNLKYDVKLWMVNDKGESVFGNGLAELLEEVNKTHSMLEASKNLNMSYRYALHRITLAEKRLGERLVNRTHGGARGGGFSEVTSCGKTLISRYREAKTKLENVLKNLP